MMTQSNATIYLADQRGASQTDAFRSLHTFNFGQYFDENRQSFGSLQVFNDDTLKAESSLKMEVKKDTQVILLPIVGGLEYKNSFVKEGFLEAGQAQVFAVAQGTSYEIINPYEAGFINFLQIWLTADNANEPTIQQGIIDLETRKNCLLPIFPAEVSPALPKCFIGKYDGREDGIYHLTKPTNAIFAFVIDGVFEVQNRLLHARDGLALSNLTTMEHPSVEFEALSNNAIILLLEMTA